MRVAISAWNQKREREKQRRYLVWSSRKISRPLGRICVRAMQLVTQALSLSPQRCKRRRRERRGRLPNSLWTFRGRPRRAARISWNLSARCTTRLCNAKSLRCDSTFRPRSPRNFRVFKEVISPPRAIPFASKRYPETHLIVVAQVHRLLVASRRYATR